MSKQIYIDSNGNEIQVSGTVNSADMLPIEAGSSKMTSEAIGDLSQLTTSVKSSLVGAVNEIARYTPVYGNTASGAIATFDTSLALPLQDCTIDINAVQEGSGTPSPSNVRNIVGFNGANIAVKGANLFSLTEDTIRTDRQVSLSTCTKTDTSVTATSTANNYACFGRYLFLPKGTYTVKFQATSSELGYTPTITIYRDGTTVVRSGIRPNTPTTFTLTDNKIVEVRMFVTYSNDPTIRTVTFSDIQIEKGNSVSETYTPYVGNTTAITWQDEAGTVYGGSLKVYENGIVKMLAEYACETYDNTNNWQEYSNGNGYVVTPTGMASGSFYNDDRALINRFVKVNNNNSGLGARIGINNNRLYIVNANNNITGVTDLTSWKNWLSSNSITLVYPLATPVEYTLTSIPPIYTLNGTNNIFGDTNGDTSVVYACSLKDYIDSQ